MHIPGGYEKSKQSLIDDYFDDEEDEYDDVFEAFILENQEHTIKSSLSQNFKSFFTDQINKEICEINYDKYNITEDIKSCIINHNLNQIIKILQKYELEINYKLKFGWSILMYAVNIGAINITQYLLENAADVGHSEGIRVHNKL